MSERRGRRQGPGTRSRRSQPTRQARSRPAGPRGLGGEQVEGRHAVRELLLAGTRRVRDVWVVPDAEEHGALTDVVELAGELRVPVRRVRREELEKAARSEAPQGVLAHAAPLPETDLDGLCAPPGQDRPFVLFLDGITDPQNLGALLRTAECAGVTGVVLPRHRAAHVTPTVAKAAAGAIEHLPMALVGGMPAALARARHLGVWLVGLDAGGKDTVFDLEVAAEPVGLVLGAEGKGLGRLTRTRCDMVVSIPLRGALPSLNVAAAAAVACYEIARHR